jgi:anti-anti-sigma factor
MESSVRRTLADDGTAEIIVCGEVDYANFGELTRGVRESLLDWSPSAVRVDLARADFIDSTGLGALIEGYQATIEAEIPFIVVNPTNAFRRVLEVTGLSELFGLTESHRTVAEATGA